jgi:hypothetical protein
MVLWKQSSSKSLPESVAELEQITQRLMNSNAERLDEARNALSLDERRVMEYFWNSKKQRLRKRVPYTVLLFFETDEYHDSLHPMITSRLNLVLLKLEIKKFLSKKGDPNGAIYELAADGVGYMKSKHPDVLMYWTRLLQLAPPSLSLFVAAVGFVASIFGIIQFIDWLQQRFGL